MNKPANLTDTEIRNGDALFRAMGDQHLTKAQRMEIAAMITEFLDEAAARA